MLKLLNYLILLILPLLLSGCLVGKNRYIHNREHEYLTSKNLPKLKLPAHLHAGEIQPAYPIPDSNTFKQPTAPSLLPPGNNRELAAIDKKPAKLNTVKMEMGQDSYGSPVLSIATHYALVWSSIINVLPQAGYQILGSDRKTGIITVRVPRKNGEVAQIYQFTLSQDGATTAMQVLDQTGQVIPSSISKPMLQSLSRQLKKDHG